MVSSRHVTFLLPQIRSGRNGHISPKMAPDSPETTHPFLPATPSHQYLVPEVPIEIVSDDEMALIEAAFAIAAAARSSSSSHSSSFHQNSRSIGSITRLSKRGLSRCTENASLTDIEDLSGGGGGSSSPIGTQEKMKKSKLVTESLLHRFRKKKGLCVTDITATEWCEKQQEFLLVGGKPKPATKAMKAGIARHAVLEKEEWCEKQQEFLLVGGKTKPATKAMKAGIARHAVLEKEIINRVPIRVKSAEDAWALKILNFVNGANQLLFDGLTRELPIISFTEGVCIIGVIDEIRMKVTETQRVPALVETKTRSQNDLPSDPQRRNGRLQLMCYKHLLDNLISSRFPSRKFLNSFSLNPNQILSDDIRESTAKSGYPSETLNDLLRCYQNTCSMLPLSQDQLILRYEYQKDHSLIGEDEFLYDSSWVKSQLKSSLEFWRGEREAYFVPEEERWKCRYCKYANICPINIIPEEKQEDTQQTDES